MGRPAKGPRLYFDQGRGGWVIRHGTAFIRVGGNREQAEAQLQRYMSLRALDAPRKRTAPFLGMVYFITAAHPGYPIKVGFTESMKSMRLSQLQTACPYSLYLIGMMPGTMGDERQVHAAFDHLRMRGEWFRSEPELWNYINAACPDAAGQIAEPSPTVPRIGLGVRR